MFISNELRMFVCINQRNYLWDLAFLVPLPSFILLKRENSSQHILTENLLQIIPPNKF